MSWCYDNFDSTKISTIFFGGGTPSLMPPFMVENLINHAEKLFRFEKNIEITLEANPTSSEAKNFSAYYKAGVNRLSMGIQALNDIDLKRLGRTHSTSEALQAFDIAKNIFNRVSFDLIYARENQTLQDWEDELKKALSYSIDHISLYQLTIEENTRFADLYKLGKITLPQDELANAMYEQTHNILSQCGYDRYEISNYAKIGQECRHNLAYWRYQPYIGIGPGAHGRIYKNQKFYATQTIKSPQTWLDSVATKNHGMELMTILTPQEQAEEMLLMGLRLKEGININRFETICNKQLYQDNLNFLIEQKFLFIDNTQLIATQKGLCVLNSIIAELL
jgi:oxygen-independent coproporphyrinogen-3 oxidase